MYIFIVLMLAAGLNVTAQVFLKLAANTLKAGITWFGFCSLFINFNFWLGAFLYGGSFLLYIIVLSKGELSRIGPVAQALTLIGLLIVSTVKFSESVTPLKVVGFVFLLIGIAAISNKA